MPTRREKERKQLRYSDAKKVAEEQGSGFTPTAFTVPEGMSLFRFRQAKTYNLDIIPYVVGKGNPRADEGMVHFERTYYVHQKVGPNNDSIPCLAKNWKKKCPICQYRAKLGMDPKTKKDVLKALEPKVRQLWIIRDRDELEKGLQLMDSAYYKSFGELIKSKTKAGDDEAPYHNFFHLTGGMYLKVTSEEASYDGRKFFKPTNIEMRPRKDLKESLLDKAPCLDDLLVEKSYKELREMFLQINDDDEEDDDDVEDGSELEDEDEVEEDSELEGDEEEEDSELEGDEEEEEAPAKKKSSKKKKDEDEDEEESDTEDEESEDDDEDPKPAKKSGKGSKKPAKGDEEDEESDDGDDSDGDSDDEDEEESEDDEEGDEVEFGKGDRVSGVYKSKKFKGKVASVQTRKGKDDLITILTDGGNKRVMDASEVTLISKAKKKEAEDEEGEDEEEIPSKKSKPSSKKASKPTGKKSSKKDEEDDEDDDIPFEDEDEGEDD